MPSRALTRRDPPNGKNGFSIPKGFTVVELMVAIAVLAIVMSLALPSYQTLIEKRRVTSSAEQVMAFLSSAQLESVKRNRFVAVNMNSDGTEWCLGMIAGDTDAVSCDCLALEGEENACEIDNALRVLDSSGVNYPEMFEVDSSSLGGDDDTFAFDPVRGLTVGAESVELQFLSGKGTYALNVEMNAAGRVNMCSDVSRSSKCVPGYESCDPDLACP